MLYESIEHRAELKLSCHLPNYTMFNLFQEFFLAFFAIIESEISEQASRQVATEEPNICKHTRHRILCYENVSRYENPQRKNKIDIPSFKD